VIVNRRSGDGARCKPCLPMRSDHLHQPTRKPAQRGPPGFGATSFVCLRAAQMPCPARIRCAPFYRLAPPEPWHVSAAHQGCATAFAIEAADTRAFVILAMLLQAALAAARRVLGPPTFLGRHTYERQVPHLESHSSAAGGQQFDVLFHAGDFYSRPTSGQIAAAWSGAFLRPAMAPIGSSCCSTA